VWCVRAKGKNGSNLKGGGVTRLGQSVSRVRQHVSVSKKQKVEQNKIKIPNKKYRSVAASLESITDFFCAQVLFFFAFVFVF
jgi:hypothetical protein